jgi:hypothetical protein
MKNFWLVALALLFVLKGKLLLRSYSMLYLQKQQTHQAERERELARLLRQHAQLDS